MDIELLRTFLEVNRLKHFGQAAEVLHLTQAAISARIKNLEQTLGVRLFHRARRDIRLTAEGARLVRYAERLIFEWRKARQDVTAGGAAQQISIGGSLRLWDVLLQDWLQGLRKTIPDLAIIAESHSPEVLTRRLIDGLLDVAFMLEPAQLDVLRIKEIAIVQLVMVSTRPGQTPANALGRDYVMVDWGLAHALEHRRSYPDAPEPQIRLGQAKMALSYLRSCGGAAYLPIRMCTQELAAGVIHLVKDAVTFDRHAYAVYPIRSVRESLIRQILERFEHKVTLESLHLA